MQDAHNTRRPGAQSDLEILSETVMVGVPRGDGREEMRVTFTKARSADGKDICWHSVGVFWRGDDGLWRRSKNVATVRGRELHAVAGAFARATQGARPTAPSSPPAASPQRPPGARPPEHRQSSARQPSLPVDPTPPFGDDVDEPDPDGVF